MNEALFWRVCGVLLLVMGVVAGLTAAGMRGRHQPWRTPLLYGVLAVGAGVVLEVVVR